MNTIKNLGADLLWTLQSKDGGLHAVFPNASAAETALHRGLAENAENGDSPGWHYFVRSVSSTECTELRFAALRSRIGLDRFRANGRLREGAMP